MKKVYIFCPIDFEGVYNGGIISIVNSYINNSERFRDNDVFLFYDKDSQNNNLNKPKTVIGKIRYHIGYIRRYIKLLELVSSQYDVIHFHTSRGLHLLEDLIIVKKLKKKEKFSSKIYISIHRAELNKTISRNYFIQSIFLKLLNNADKIIYLSRSTMNEFADRGLDRLKLRYLPTFFNYDTTPYVRDEFYKAKINVLFVGFLNKEKGIYELLEAMKKMPSNIVLHVCGTAKDNDNDFNKYISNNTFNNVIFHGYVSGLEKEELFKLADVFVLPSYGEGLPLVILEALHFSLPIITTKVGAIPEVLGDDNAIFVDMKSVDSLYKSIFQLVNNNKLRNKMSNNNSILSMQFSLDENIKMLCSYYLED